MSRPLISVISFTYNRPQHVAPLIESVLAQDFDDWEIVIAEDHSPAREQVREIVASYSAKYGDKIRLHLNDENYGYDKAFRTCVEQARGEYVFVMGDDDFVAPGALHAVADVVNRYPNVGVILRALAYFSGTTDNITHVTRYYASECSFPAGEEAIIACYRRMVAMSGLVFHRDSAAAVATDRFDGTIFYQHWLAAKILVHRDAVYIPKILAYFRVGSVPMFGNAAAERGTHTPGVQPPENHIKHITGQMRIARVVEEEDGVSILPLFTRDLANYMYPVFANQAHNKWPVFYKYYRDLGKLGFDRYPSFHAWFWLVATIRPKRLAPALNAIRRVVGHTPNLSSFVRPKRRPGRSWPATAPQPDQRG